MPDIISVAQDYLDRLADIESQATTQAIDGFADILSRLQDDLKTTLAQIQQEMDAGRPIPPSLVRRDERLRRLIEQTQNEIDHLAAQLSDEIIAGQVQATTLAQEAANKLIQEALGPDAPITVRLTNLPVEAVQQLLGTLSDGSPLADLLATLGPEGAKAVRDALISGLASGLSPDQIARSMRDAVGMSLTRALRIVRTEILRSYRETALQTYRANADVMESWVWIAELDTSTCGFCIAQHGSIHPLDDPFASHVNCRCAPAPVTRSWADLGFPGIPDNRPEIESGADWFAAQPESVQLSILGPAKFAAFQDGAITLDDLIGQRDDAQWGPVGWERSLKDILGSQEAAEWRMAAD